MMRSYLTRLVNSVTQVAPVTPCLLIGLACATPFPVENLEEGMTAEVVRESFGEPAAIMKIGLVGANWGYVDEKQNWNETVASSTLFLPVCALVTAVTMPFGWEHWCSALLPTVEEGKVVLQFEWEKLARWEVFAPPPRVYQPPEEESEQMRAMHQWLKQRTKDVEHHKKGHEHHHDTDATHHAKGHQHHHASDHIPTLESDC